MSGKSVEDALEGQLINRKYRVLKRLGQGGMGMVYLSNVEGPAGFEKLVALKVVHAHIAHDQQVVEMFLTEARLSAQLSHANLAQIYDLGDSDGLYYIAMEYVRGRDLRGLMTAVDEREGRVPLPLCVFIIARLCEGLDYAHAVRDKNGNPLKLVHRDVTPVNCLLSFAGEVKVIDFGIAKAANVASRTRNGIIRGKLAYMSPEQTLGTTLDKRSDIFALGVILYELLIGARPFDLQDDNELKMIDRIRSGEHPRAAELDPEIHPELDRIVEKALTVDRDQRYATAGAMHEDLQRFLLTQQIHVGARDLSAFLVEMIGADVARADGATPEALSAQSNLKRKKDGTTELRSRIITQPDNAPVPGPTKESVPPTRIVPQHPKLGAQATVVGVMPTENDLPKVSNLSADSHPTLPPPSGKTTVPSRRGVLPDGPLPTLHDRPSRPGGFVAERLPTEDVPSGVVRQLHAMRQGQTPNPVATDPTRIATVPLPPPVRRAPITEAGATDPHGHPARRGATGPVAVAAVLVLAAAGAAWWASRTHDVAESAPDAGSSLAVIQPREPSPQQAEPLQPPAPVKQVDPSTEPVAHGDPLPLAHEDPTRAAATPPLPAPERDAGLPASTTRQDTRKVTLAAHDKPRPKPQEPKAEPLPPARPVVMGPMAFLTVKANETSEVFVDGASIGMTPRLRAVVAPGKHELRVDCVYSWGRVRGAPKVVDFETDEVAAVNHACKDQPPP